MNKLNPFDAKRREADKKNQADRHAKRVAGIKAARKDKNLRAAKKSRNTRY